uniref:Uncharacterized protein n=1 Tax=Trypanosoma vivax (strain Y486) TaxID=1055687 RepID=G0U9E3_TRYVY|nr:hypothetical protein TVY486_1117120 [Trypanosoma vivax Y486]
MPHSRFTPCYANARRALFSCQGPFICVTQPSLAITCVFTYLIYIFILFICILLLVYVCNRTSSGPNSRNTPSVVSVFGLIHTHTLYRTPRGAVSYFLGHPPRFVLPHHPRTSEA